MTNLTIVGLSHGEAAHPVREELPQRARRLVRYADPVAWQMATAANRALKGWSTRMQPFLNSVGLVSVSATGPSEALRHIASSAGAGLVSPLRFPAANAGTLAAVTCIAFEFRGPTLNLTMPCRSGVPKALEFADYWVSAQAISFVLVSSHIQLTASDHLARCVLFGGPAWLADEKIGKAWATAWLCHE